MSIPIESPTTIDPLPEAIPESHPTQSLFPLKDFQTRFLYPFFFDRQEVTTATAALEGATLAGKAGVWECADPKAVYTEEVLDHVVEFLFPAVHSAGCGYLKVSDAVSQAWFQGATVLLGDGRSLPVGLVPGLRIELFLSPYGVGIVTIALTPTHLRSTPIDPSDAVEFNYRLAQLQPWSAAKIRLPHPGDSPESLARLTEADRQKILPSPPHDAPLANRLGKRGGTFTLAELVEQLLGPLKGLGMESVQPIFSVYTVARCGPEADMGLSEVRDAIAPFLSALSQIEEPDHAGAVPGPLELPNAVLNRRHWAAVGQLGAAHVVADQPDDHPFNEQRVPRVRDKYFIQYLMAVLQRLVVHRAIDRAEAILAKTGVERDSDLEALRGDLLRFAVEGHFTQVSTRHALHRFYLVAREGLDVADAWSEVRQAIADIDARVTQQRQEKVADGVAGNMKAMAEVADDLDRVTHKMDENLGIVAGVQRMVHYIEMAIVSVYFAHLWHMFADNESLKEWVNEKTHLHGAGDWLVSIGVLVWAAIGFVLALILGRVLHGHAHSVGKH